MSELSNWTYSFDPSASLKDQVRFLIGDTDQNDPLLYDKEITWVLGQYNNSPMNAAIRCCETIAAKFSRMADEKAGPVSVTYSQKSKQYRDLRQELVSRLAVEDMAPYAGGISKSDKATVRDDSDRVEPTFEKHMMENHIVDPQAPSSGEFGTGGL